ncbi:MAG: phosphotransferase [Candidatus Anstonellales archaeon]
MTHLSKMCRDYLLFRKKIFLQKTDIPKKIIRMIKKRRLPYDKIKNEINNRIVEYFQVKPRRINLFAETLLHILFEIEIDKKMILVCKINKLPNSYGGLSIYLDDIVKHIMQKIRLPFPHIYRVNTLDKKLGFSYEILDKISSNKISTLANKNELCESVFYLGKMCGVYHSSTFDFFGHIDVCSYLKGKRVIGCYERWSTYIFTNLDKHIRICERIGAIDYHEAEKILRKFDYKEVFDIEKGSLLHGDLGNHNAFIEKNKVTLIDWEDAIIGDPLYDIAYWGSFTPNEDLKIFSSFIKGYTSVKSLPHDWKIKYWLYYLRIALAKTIHRYLFDYTELKEYKIKRALKELDEIGI